MKQFFLILLLAGFCASLCAQDIITFRNGDEVKAKVEEVGEETIRYKKFGNPDGPTYSVLISDIFMIVYENGFKDVFTEEKVAEEVEEVEIAEDSEDLGTVEEEFPDEIEAVLPDEGCAVLYIYRKNAFQGSIISYDLYLEDEKIFRAANKSKTTVIVNIAGINTLHAKTEVTTKLPIEIECGREYYIRCGIKMGIAVGRPSIELVDEKTGKSEFDKIP
jgi:hypothetical protein